MTNNEINKIIEAAVDEIIAEKEITKVLDKYKLKGFFLSSKESLTELKNDEAIDCKESDSDPLVVRDELLTRMNYLLEEYKVPVGVFAFQLNGIEIVSGTSKDPLENIEVMRKIVKRFDHQ